MQKFPSTLQDLEILADWMDARFLIPGTSIKFGLDSLIGLLPGIGDTVGFLVSAYILHRARDFNVPRTVKFKMGWNIFLDWLIGLVPFLGDLFDVGWKANKKNVALIRQHGKFL